MRLLISILGWMILGLTVDASSASSQEPGRVYRIGWLDPNWVNAPPVVFRDAMRDGGYVVGKNLVIEPRYAKDDANQLASQAEALGSRLN